MTMMINEAARSEKSARRPVAAGRIILHRPARMAKKNKGSYYAYVVAKLYCTTCSVLVLSQY
jgi:hypothetical protein